MKDTEAYVVHVAKHLFFFTLCKEERGSEIFAFSLRLIAIRNFTTAYQVTLI
jgi:hypothetical protein